MTRAHGRFLRSAFVLALLALLSMPVHAGEILMLASSAARTAPGSGTSIPIGNLQRIGVVVSVTAGSGTVTTFRVWIEQSTNGTTFAETPCDLVLKGGATSPGSAPAVPQRDIVNETVAITSATYTGTCQAAGQFIRAGWSIAGTTPSETFSAFAFAK